ARGIAASDQSLRPGRALSESRARDPELSRAADGALRELVAQAPERRLTRVGQRSLLNSRRGERPHVGVATGELDNLDVDLRGCSVVVKSATELFEQARFFRITQIDEHRPERIDIALHALCGPLGF